MHNGCRMSRLQTTDLFTQQPRTDSQPGFPEPRFRHVLVSTGLTIADRTALLLGFELASLHGSTLTLLHVLPRPKKDHAHGLDAVSLLHAAAEELRGASTAGLHRDAPQPSLRKFVEHVVPLELRDSVRWRGVCRAGDVADTVVSYANDFAADLVILPVQPFRWWLPIVPFAVWTIQRRARANVIVVRDRAPPLASQQPNWQAPISHSRTAQGEE